MKANWLIDPNKTKLENAVKESFSLTQVLRKIGRSVKSPGNYNSLRRHIFLLKLDISHFDPYRGTLVKLKALSPEDVLVENCIYSQSTLRKIIKKNNLIDYVCQDCGVRDIYNNKKIVLQIDHINGINFDNRLFNLRYLCPNCHSQTSNFGNKNRSRIQKKYPLDSEIIDQYRIHNSMVRVKQHFKIPISYIRKVLDSHKVSRSNFKKTKYKEYDKKEVLKEYMKIGSYEKVAIKMELSGKVVRNVVKQYIYCKNGCDRIIRTSNKTNFCADCYNHSQEHRDKHQRINISKEELSVLVTEMPMTDIGKKFGCSEAAIRKKCRVFGIVFPIFPRGHWIKQQNRNRK
jgi:transposase-like protein